ncbi:MAG: class I SAM-dependent methyltransferase [Anaerolineae bacterium]
MREINCPICDVNHSEHVYQVRDRLLGVEGEFTLVRCLECGLLYLNPQPTVEEIVRYYPPKYYSYVSVPPGELSWPHRMVLNYGLYKRCQAVTRCKKEGRLLEVGCANGAFLDAMRRTGGWDVYGVDISEHAVRCARDQLGLNVFHGQLQDARFPNHFFDIVVLWDVLEHLPDPKSALLEIRRVLAPDGWLIFRVPNLDSLDARIFGPYWAGLDAPRHFFIFSETTLKRLLELCGFTLYRMTCISGTYPAFVLSMRLWARDHLSPRTQDWVQRVLESLPTRLLVAPIFQVVDRLKKSTVVTVYARYAQETNREAATG